MENAIVCPMPRFGTSYAFSYESRTADVVVGAELQVGRVHLHDERLVALLLLPGAPVLPQHEQGCQDKGQARGHGEHEAPGQVVEVGVQQPVAVPAAEAEDGHGQEEAGRGGAVARAHEAAKVVLEAQGHLQRVPVDLLVF